MSLPLEGPILLPPNWRPFRPPRTTPYHLQAGTRYLRAITRWRPNLHYRRIPTIRALPVPRSRFTSGALTPLPTALQQSITRWHFPPRRT